MEVILVPFLNLMDSLLGLLSFVIVAMVVLEWLFRLNIITLSNRLLCNIYEFSRRITHPLFDYIGRFIPPIGGLDISPIIVIFLISFVRNIIAMILLKILS